MDVYVVDVNLKDNKLHSMADNTSKTSSPKHYKKRKCQSGDSEPSGDNADQPSKPSKPKRRTPKKGKIYSSGNWDVAAEKIDDKLFDRTTVKLINEKNKDQKERHKSDSALKKHTDRTDKADGSSSKKRKSRSISAYSIFAGKKEIDIAECIDNRTDDNVEQSHGKRGCMSDSSHHDKPDHKISVIPVMDNNGDDSSSHHNKPDKKKTVPPIIDSNGGEKTSSDTKHSIQHDSEELDYKLPETLILGCIGKDISIVKVCKGGILLAGYASVRCLRGTVSVMGYTINQTQKTFLPIFSPDSASRLTITAHENSNNSETDWKEQLSALGADEVVMTEVNEVDSTTPILLFKQLDCPITPYVVSIGNYKSLFRVSEIDAKYFESIPGTECQVANLGDYEGALAITKEQQKFMDTFSHLSATGGRPIVILCGGKNAGKSTMARCLINSVLSNGSNSVGYLECDIGQTELSPPGCVALHVITEPLLGPPFTHQRTAHAMNYVGAVTPAADPSYYLSCMQNVHEQYTKLKEKPALIVNTMGWNMGLGLSFLRDTVCLLKPSHVVQIESINRRDNFPSIDQTFLSNTPGLNVMKHYFSSQYEEQNWHHDLVVIQSPVVNKGHCGQYHPIDHRNMSLFAHLKLSRRLNENSNEADNSLNRVLAGAVPSVLPWQNVCLHSIYQDIPNSQILNALNGSLVALCVSRDPYILSSDAPGLPLFCANISSPPVCTCLSLGLVQGIDIQNKCLLIISPLSQEEVNRTNCILLGSVELPSSVLLNEPLLPNTELTYVPYIGHSQDVTGASSIKSRRHLLQKQDQN